MKLGMTTIFLTLSFQASLANAQDLFALKGCNVDQVVAVANNLSAVQERFEAGEVERTEVTFAQMMLAEVKVCASHETSKNLACTELQTLQNEIVDRMKVLQNYGSYTFTDYREALAKQIRLDLWCAQ